MRGVRRPRKVFISYRGVDADYAPSLLQRELCWQFGKDWVFLDTENIVPGEDYVERLISEVKSSAVLLAVIGPQWLTISDSAGQRLIDKPGDWIRRELTTAFAAGIKVIPVFTDGATVPAAADLPPDIAQLGRRQGLWLRHREFSTDLKRVVHEVQKAVVNPEVRKALVKLRRRLAIHKAMLMATAVIALAASVTFWILGSNQASPDSPVSPGAQSGAPAHSPSSSPRQTTSADPTTTITTSSAPPATAVVREWWRGTVTLDANTFTTGYSLDAAPPARTPLGDLGLVCDLSCYPNEIAGTAFAAWNGSGQPDRQRCTDTLDSQVGQRRLDVRVGTVACLRTERGRVGYLRVASITGPGQMKIDVTVWELPT